MDTSDNARKYLSFRELLFDANVQRWEFAKMCGIVSGSHGVNAAFDVSAIGLAKLVEAIKEGDRSRAHEILCGWGIRR